jgi:primosomal protein N' (replication factor Y)
MGEPQTFGSSDSASPLFAEIIVPRHLAGPFTYLVPASLRAVLRVGHLVFVPFGRSLVQGAVVALTPHRPSTLPLERLKAIHALVTDDRAVEIPPPLLQLAKAVAEAYVAPWGQCLRLVLPPKSTTRDMSRILLTKEGQEALAATKTISAAVLHLLKRLKRRPLGIPLSRLRTKEGAHEDVLASILDRGWAHKVRARTAPKIPDVFGSRPGEESKISTKGCNFEWQGRVLDALQRRTSTRLLVQAELAERLALLRAAAVKTVELGRKVLVITGETARAESLAAALGHRPAATVVLHGTMPDDKRSEIWERIRQNQVSIVVGTRAALFLPLDPIGLIWIDREEDPALKEPMEPRYHAREVAWMRAQQAGALLILGSAHLSLEASGLEPSERLLEAPRRADSSPEIEVVDLRREDRRLLLSSRLQEAMRDAMARGTGVLLFLNRKAYAGAVVCRDCGQVPRCPSCTVAFAFSRQKNVLFCHYCGATHAISDLCAACGSARLHPVGEGTERLEEDVKRRFPSVRVLRVDGETMRRPKEAEAIWTRVHRREWDVLVGTQLLLRDSVVPPVGLAGAVQADAGLSLPDFRAAERTFHLLQDAAALVQPLSAGGRLIIQTYLPSHHAIEAVARQDEAIFRAEEMMHRTALGFPPALRVIVLHISGAVEAVVERAAQAWAAALTDAAKAVPEREHLTVLGPVRSPVPRVRGRYRRQILVKCRPAFMVAQTIRSTLCQLESRYPRRTVKFDVDVDPTEMW